MRGHFAQHHVLGGIAQPVTAVGHARRDVVGDHVPDVVLAPAGAGHGAVRVSPRACTNQRRIAHPTPALVRHAARGRRRGKVPAAVQRDRAHGAEIAATQVRIGLPCLLLLALRLDQLQAPGLGGEPRVRHPLDLRMQVGELFRAGTDQEHVR